MFMDFHSMADFIVRQKVPEVLGRVFLYDAIASAKKRVVCFMGFGRVDYLCRKISGPLSVSSCRNGLQSHGRFRLRLQIISELRKQK